MSKYSKPFCSKIFLRTCVSRCTRSACAVNAPIQQCPTVFTTPSSTHTQGRLAVTMPLRNLRRRYAPGPCVLWLEKRVGTEIAAKDADLWQLIFDEAEEEDTFQIGMELKTSAWSPSNGHYCIDENATFMRALESFGSVEWSETCTSRQDEEDCTPRQHATALAKN
jgi:hypothetical protein